MNRITQIEFEKESLNVQRDRWEITYEDYIAKFDRLQCEMYVAIHWILEEPKQFDLFDNLLPK